MQKGTETSSTPGKEREAESLVSKCRPLEAKVTVSLRPREEPSLQAVDLYPARCFSLLPQCPRAGRFAPDNTGRVRAGAGDPEAAHTWELGHPGTRMALAAM